MSRQKTSCRLGAIGVRGMLAVAIAGSVMAPGLALADSLDAPEAAEVVEATDEALQDEALATEAPDEVVVPDGGEPADVPEVAPVDEAPATDAADTEVTETPDVAVEDETTADDATPSADAAEQQDPAADPLTTMEEGAQEPAEAPVAEGTYAIGSGLAEDKVVEIKGGSTANGTAAQISSSTGAAQQHWKLVLDAETGTYQIVNSKTGMALAAAETIVKSGTKVVQRALAAADKAQRWILVGDDVSGYHVVPVLADTLSLNVAGAKNADGTALQLAARSDAASQLFYFYMLDGIAPATEAVLKDGAYTIKNGSRSLAVKGSATKAGANVQYANAQDVSAQKWYLTYSKGYYRIVNVESGLALGLAGAGDVPGSNVQLVKSANVASQLWRIDKDGSSFVLVNKHNGLVLDLADGKKSNGTNVDVWRVKDAKGTQIWALQQVGLLTEGFQTFFSSLSTDYALGIKGYSTKSGAPVRLSVADGNQAQRWYVSKNANGTYTIKNLNSNRYLGASGTKLVQTSAKTAWTAVMGSNGVMLTLGGKAITVSSVKANKALKLAASKGSANQSLHFETTSALADGTYMIKSLLGTVVEVKEGSGDNGANIRMAKYVNDASQVFKITRNSDGTYKVVNALTGLAMEVKGGSKNNGANVVQRKANSKAAEQKWNLNWSNGRFIFVNAKTGLTLEVKGNSKKRGTNVQQGTATGKKGQKWVLKATEPNYLSSNKELNSYIKSMIKSHKWKGKSGLKKAYKNIATYGYDLYEANYIYSSWKKWSVSRAKSMYLNHEGNCYGFAALFTWVARGLGYNAKAITGKVFTAHGWSPHGWSEVAIGGKTYVVDVQQYQNDQAHGLNHNFFLVTYDEAPVYYHVGYDI